MPDTPRGQKLFEVLRELAIVSAALNHKSTNRQELLARRDMLVQAAQQLGFPLTAGQQESMKERLQSQATLEEKSTKGTKDHDEILGWALAHDAVPGEVKRPVFDHAPSALRFLSGEAKKGTPELRPISWEDFFERFDLMGLAVVFDDEMGDYEFVPTITKPVRPPN